MRTAVYILITIGAVLSGAVSCSEEGATNPVPSQIDVLSRHERPPWPLISSVQLLSGERSREKRLAGIVMADMALDIATPQQRVLLIDSNPEMGAARLMEHPSFADIPLLVRWLSESGNLGRNRGAVAEYLHFLVSMPCVNNVPSGGADFDDHEIDQLLRWIEDHSEAWSSTEFEEFMSKGIGTLDEELGESITPKVLDAYRHVWRKLLMSKRPTALLPQIVKRVGNDNVKKAGIYPEIALAIHRRLGYTPGAGRQNSGEDTHRENLLMWWETAKEKHLVQWYLEGLNERQFHVPHPQNTKEVFTRLVAGIDSDDPDIRYLSARLMTMLCPECPPVFVPRPTYDKMLTGDARTLVNDSARSAGRLRLYLFSEGAVWDPVRWEYRVLSETK